MDQRAYKSAIRCGIGKQCYFSCCFLVSVSVKLLDHKFFSVIIKFQLFLFSFYFSYYYDFSVSVPVSVVNVGRPNVIISWHKNRPTKRDL